MTTGLDTTVKKTLHKGGCCADAKPGCRACHAKSARLTPRENFRRMMNRQGPAWLPLDVWITPPILDEIERRTGTRDLHRALGVDIQGVGIEYPDEPARWRDAFDRLGVPMPRNAEVFSFGLTTLTPDRRTLGPAYHLREMFHPLLYADTAEQVRAMPWPDVHDPRLYAPLRARVEAAHARGLVAAGWMSCTLFEMSWYLRGMEQLFLDLIEDNPVGTFLLDWFTERSVAGSRALVEAGVDAVLLGDDVGTQRGMMMSVEFWRRHLKPRLGRVIAAIRAAEREHTVVFYHSDGDVRPIIGDLIELGVDVLNPMQPECMPAREVIPEYQDRLGFWGMIGTQTTMPFGTPDDVRAAVAELAGLARGGAPIVVAPTHMLEPDVPWANIQALIEAVRAERLE